MKNTMQIKNYLWLIKPICGILSLLLCIQYSFFSSPQSFSNSSFASLSHKTYVQQDESSSQSDTAKTQPQVETTSGSVTQTDSENGKEDKVEPSASEMYEYKTADDIKAYEEEYLATFALSEQYGSVEEVFFKTSGATDSVDGIYIKNATATKTPDFSALLQEGPVLTIEDKSLPTVLIFHTHTTESYLLSDNGVFYEDYQTRSTDPTKNMVRVGDEICKVLESNGIGYIHDTNIYDEAYDGAYSRSRVSVEKYLEEYPTIKIVLDVHRDAIYYSDTSHCKPTAVINGRKAAQIMIITGAEEGYISDFPDWEDNLKFALCFQKTAEENYSGLMKPIYFCQRKYNMDTAKCSLLLEMGTDSNTLDEAVYSGYLTGKVLSEIIDKYSGGTQ